MDQVFHLTYASSLTNLCEVNQSFDTGVLRVCYTGQNRKNSSISREVLTRCLPTLYNCPVVCNYDRESDTIGGHDMEVVSDDGGLRIVNVTVPCGVIPESANTWFEEYEDENGVTREYLYTDVLLWKRQEVYRKLKADGIAAHSMEINIRKGKKANGVYHIDDFEFNALCLIGKEPCYEGAALELFSRSDFKQQLSQMMQDLKETYTQVNPSKEDDNTHPQNSTEGGEVALDKKQKMIAKYGIDVDTLTFSIDEFDEEELEAKFRKMTETTPETEPATFELHENIVKELVAALGCVKFRNRWGDETVQYQFVDFDADALEVYCWDCNDWLLYGFAYSMDGDRVVIDFGSKKRMKYAIVEFDGGEQVSPFATTFATLSEQVQEYADLKASFSTLGESLKAYETELNELRNFKLETETATETALREELFSLFADLEGADAFEALKQNALTFSLEDLEEKCYAIRGRMAANTAKFSLEQKVPKLKVAKTNEETEPYGGLLAKYAVKGSN